MIKIHPVTPDDHDEWLRLRFALWPEPQHTLAELETEAAAIHRDHRA